MCRSGRAVNVGDGRADGRVDPVAFEWFAGHDVEGPIGAARDGPDRKAWRGCDEARRSIAEDLIGRPGGDGGRAEGVPRAVDRGE